jgi:ABC-type multidrug transport system ATPase subunit
LDSSTAYSLVEKLQQLASIGRTIVTTIHQPRFVFF